MEFYVVMGLITATWFAMTVPPRTPVEWAVTVAAVVLWPAFMAYTLYVGIARIRRKSA